MEFSDPILLRAQGCLLGQLIGDSLGSLVEFQTPEQIQRKYPQGVRNLENGGTWNTLAGQPTDDSEMALSLTHLLIERGTYDQVAARQAYLNWLESNPFDCGQTILAGLQGTPNFESQANGALMRISPLGIFGAKEELSRVAKWAEQDAQITHPHPICIQANILFTMGITTSIQTELEPYQLYQKILQWANELPVAPALFRSILQAENAPPSDYIHQQGFVLTAFQNALFQLLHAKNLEEGIVDTIMRGGDTDTNAAICGALLGAVYGKTAVPLHFIQTLENCRPEKGIPHVYHPRPSCFWPVDVLTFAEKLITRKDHSLRM